MANLQSTYITNKIQIAQSVEQQAENLCFGISIQAMANSNNN